MTTNHLNNPADLSANFTIGECGIEPPFVLDGNNSFNTQLQVGINNSSSSQIEVNWNLDLKFLTNLRAIGENGVNVLSKIEKMATSVQSAQTSIGAVQNRLESALDEIETQFNNLVSSRSTLRDADIAEESSAYIRQQILQEASATLLATANQSPSIALQLI